MKTIAINDRVRFVYFVYDQNRKIPEITRLFSIQ